MGAWYFLNARTAELARRPAPARARLAAREREPRHGQQGRARARAEDAHRRGLRGLSELGLERSTWGFVGRSAARARPGRGARQPLRADPAAADPPRARPLRRSSSLLAGDATQLLALRVPSVRGLRDVGRARASSLARPVRGVHVRQPARARRLRPRSSRRSASSLVTHRRATSSSASRTSSRPSGSLKAAGVIRVVGRRRPRPSSAASSRSSLQTHARQHPRRRRAAARRQRSTSATGSSSPTARRARSSRSAGATPSSRRATGTPSSSRTRPCSRRTSSSSASAAGKPLQHRMWVYFNVDFRYAPSQVIDVVHDALASAPIEGVADDPKPNVICYDFAKDGRDSFALLRRALLADRPRQRRPDELARPDARLRGAAARRHPLARPTQTLFVHARGATRPSATARHRERAPRTRSTASSCSTSLTARRARVRRRPPAVRAVHRRRDRDPAGRGRALALHPRAPGKVEIRRAPSRRRRRQGRRDHRRARLLRRDGADDRRAAHGRRRRDDRRRVLPARQGRLRTDPRMTAPRSPRRSPGRSPSARRAHGGARGPRRGGTQGTNGARRDRDARPDPGVLRAGADDADDRDRPRRRAGRPGAARSCARSERTATSPAACTWCTPSPSRAVGDDAGGVLADGARVGAGDARLGGDGLDLGSRDERLWRRCSDAELAAVLEAFWTPGARSRAVARGALRRRLDRHDLAVSPRRRSSTKRVEDAIHPLTLDAGWELLPLGELDPERHKGAIAAFGDALAFESACFEEETAVPSPAATSTSSPPSAPTELLARRRATTARSRSRSSSGPRATRRTSTTSSGASVAPPGSSD